MLKGMGGGGRGSSLRMLLAKPRNHSVQLKKDIITYLNQIYDIQVQIYHIYRSIRMYLSGKTPEIFVFFLNPQIILLHGGCESRCTILFTGCTRGDTIQSDSGEKKNWMRGSC